MHPSAHVWTEDESQKYINWITENQDMIISLKSASSWIRHVKEAIFKDHPSISEHVIERKWRNLARSWRRAREFQYRLMLSEVTGLIIFVFFLSLIFLYLYFLIQVHKCKQKKKKKMN